MTSTLRTRREFLCNCGIVTAGLTLPQFLLHTATSVAAQSGWEAGSAVPLPGFKDDHVLVVIQLGGGNDGLNMLVPYSDDAYRRARPKIGVSPADLLKIDDHLAFNASATSLKKLYDGGKVAIVEGVGYPNPDRSHFRSMEIWHTASDSDRFDSTGWIGRYFDNHCEGKPIPTAGVFVGAELPQAFDGTRGMGVAFSAPESFGYVAGKKGDDTRSYRQMNAAKEPTKNESLDFLRHVTDNANISTDKIHTIAANSKNAIQYPANPLAQSLATIARMIRGGLGARLYYTAISGFDTHANQANAHNRLLTGLGDAVEAFQRDLHQMGESRRVLTLTFSEFGRRVNENASGGTDHGTAGPMMLIGDMVNPGLKGQRPSLTDLDEGDLKFTTDFRSVYATVLRHWFTINPKTVMGREFPMLDIVKA
jgi:uncharacterized protein (DUF1501 family)